MERMRKVTRNNIDKTNMVALSYCQCQMILKLFGNDYKVGYNSGVYGKNYDLYRINGVDIVTGYAVPYYSHSNKQLKNKLVALENEIRSSYNYSKYDAYKKEFFKIFE